jgi:CRISPR-associated protein Csx3
MSTDRAVTIDLKDLYGDTAKLAQLPTYVIKALALAGEGNEVVLTGQAPVWLYLKIAHALHGKAKRLIYRSPVTEDIIIFNHDPF